MLRDEWCLLPSRWRAVNLLVVVVAALWAVASCGTLVAWQWLLLVVCGLSLAREYHANRRHSVTGMALHRGRWYLADGAEILPARLLCYHFFGPFLGVLTFQLDSGARCWVSLFPDSIEREGLRRLRRALQLQHSPR